MQAEKTAVIFIEFQNDFCHPNGKLFDVVKGEMARLGTINNAKRLLDGARQKGCKIIHCPFTLDREWVKAHQMSGIIEGVFDGDVFAPGTWGHEIFDALAPQEGEIILEGKRALSGFSHTNLGELLKFGGIETVIIAGFLTNVCAQATAWGAYDLGYRVRMIPEACAAGSADLQNYVVNNVCPILGGALSVDEFLASF